MGEKQYLCVGCDSLCVVLEEEKNHMCDNALILSELSAEELQTIRLYNYDYRVNHMDEFEEYKKKFRTDRQKQIEQLFIKYGNGINE